EFFRAVHVAVFADEFHRAPPQAVVGLARRQHVEATAALDGNAEAAIVEAVEVDDLDQRADFMRHAEAATVGRLRRTHAETGGAFHAHRDQAEITRLETAQRYHAIGEYNGVQREQGV